MTEEQWRQGRKLIHRMEKGSAMLKTIQEMRDSEFPSLWVGMDDGKCMVLVPQQDRGVIIELLERRYQEEYDAAKKEFEKL